MDEHLFSCIKSGQWKKSRSKILQAPDELAFVDNRRRNVLHVLLSLHFSDDDDNDDEIVEAKALIETIMKASKVSFNNTKEVDRNNFTSLLLYRDVNDNTPLHALCGQGSASPVLINFILTNFTNDTSSSHSFSPSAIELLSALNVHGCTPLHFLAECHCSVEAISICLKSCGSACIDIATMTFPLEPDESSQTAEPVCTLSGCRQQIHPALIKDNDGDTPLHYACACASDYTTEHIRALLASCPSAVTIRNKENKLPVDDLCYYFQDSWIDLVHERITESTVAVRENDLIPDLMDNSNTESIFPVEKEVMRLELWDVLNPILEATYLGSSHKSKSDIENWRPLHAAASLACYGSHILRFAMQMKPEELSAVDENGNLPIHAAASSRTTNYPIENIHFLLKRDPCSVRAINKNKMLPFQLAIESGKNSDVLTAMLKYYPDALHIRNRCSGLLPFMSAAVAHNNTLDVVYTLLRMDPELLRCYDS